MVGDFENTKVIIINMDQFWEAFQEDQLEVMRPQLKALTADDFSHMYEEKGGFSLVDDAGLTLAYFDVTDFIKVLNIASIVYKP